MWMENSDTTLARLLLLYPTYQYLQVTSRCSTQAIYNKHLYFQYWTAHILFLLSKSKLKLHYDWQSVGQSFLELRAHLGVKTRSLLLSDSGRFIDVRHCFWQEDRSQSVISLLSVCTVYILYVIKCMYIQHIQGLCQSRLSTADHALSLVLLLSCWTLLITTLHRPPWKTPSSLVKNACLLVCYLAMDDLLLSVCVARMCSPTRCLAMGIHVTIYLFHW
jgi:hypothetical protein